MEIITGYVGSAHVTSEQEGACQAAIYGAGKYVLNSGKKFSYEVINNNKIRIKDGYAINQGRLFGTCNGDYDEVTIDNGAQGMKRRDLIAIHYTMDSASGIEAAELAVIKGTPGSDYSTPSYVTGDIVGGATEDYFPLYQVNVNGLAIESVNAVFSVKQSMEGIVSDITSLNSSLANKMEVKDLKSLYENTNTLFASDYSLATTDLNTLPLGTYKAEGNITQSTHDALHYPSDLFGNFAQLTIVNIGQTNGNDGYRKQILIASNNKIYYRVQSWNTWGAWQRLATSEDLVASSVTFTGNTEYVNNYSNAQKSGKTICMHLLFSAKKEIPEETVIATIPYNVFYSPILLAKRTGGAIQINANGQNIKVAETVPDGTIFGGELTVMINDIW